MMRALFSWICFWLALGPALAQPLPDRAPMSGLAFDAAGKPIYGALLTLRRQDQNGSFTFWGAVTASDARGAWRFAQAEAGRYFLSAEAPGFAPISNQNVTWKGGESPLVLRFERLVTLRLKMSAGDGTPLKNARFYFRLRGDGNAGQITRRATSDELGNLVLDGLLPANYAIYAATPDGFATQNGLALRSDQSLDLKVQAGGALAISTTQNGAGGRALGGAILSLTPENGAEATRALGSGADLNENIALLATGGDAPALISRDGDGQIEVSQIPPGRYGARLRLPGYALPAPQTVEILAGQSARLSFEMSPLQTLGSLEVAALTLNLRVKDASGTEKAAETGQWSVRILPIDPNGAPAPEAREDSAFSPEDNAARRALSNAAGQITLFPLKVGRYRVFVGPRILPGDDVPETASLDIAVPAGGATGTLVLPPQS